MEYIGWIVAKEKDKYLLEALGIEIGGYDDTRKEFNNCTLTKEVLSRLLPYLGRFFWHFDVIH